MFDRVMKAQALAGLALFSYELARRNRNSEDPAGSSLAFRLPQDYNPVRTFPRK